MKFKHVLCSLLIIFYSSISFADDGYTISELREYFKDNGFQAIVGLVHAGHSAEEWKETEILDEMTEMGSEETVDIQWKSRPFLEKNKLRISTSTVYAHIENAPLTTDVDGTYSCLGAASGDTLVLKLKDSRYFTYTWSCGSGGCGFWVDFIEKDFGELSDVCFK
ncbi:hypothetical protein HF888_10650 [Bermanella marisrubri]|uniref:Ig-like domain-containing protein n=1 Tax=Bermanella marisrubri TaxID=207949 RepID=Q1N5Q2_9GAMM|nr:hypothetical protein [Bermanella marisrubri]EAT13890.1 hypothetical protein RED65_10869 [Oceanobacter sp. RED65] [Bermanella marisrubri]QIZ84648.1 hypothetical protein HF888_10650 [Bermanella marisrubri]